MEKIIKQGGYRNEKRRNTIEDKESKKKSV